jgi:drug/metabolite transporter (DMT)-like permease
VNARALALLGGAQLAIGAAAIFARLALTAAGPLSVSAFRLGLAAGPVVLLALTRGAYARADPATERRLALAGCVLALHFATWIASLQHAGVAVSTLLVCSTPVFTELWAVLRTRRLRPIVLASIALAFCGVALVAGLPSRTDTPLGIALALAGAVAMAAYLLLVRASDPATRRSPSSREPIRWPRRSSPSPRLRRTTASPPPGRRRRGPASSPWR